MKTASSGNLSVFVQQLKPEHRPFTVQIDEITPPAPNAAPSYPTT